MHKYFIAIHSIITRNQRLSVLSALLLLAVFGFFAAQIKFEEDITKLIPKNDKSDDTAKVLGQLNFADKITVIFKSDADASPDDLTDMATVFLDSVQKCKPYMKSVQGTVDEENIQQTIEFVSENLPLFLDADDYKSISDKLSADSISSVVASNYRSIISPTGIVSKDFILKDPLGISFIALNKLQQLSMNDDFELYNGFVMTRDKKKLLLFINPKLPGSETEQNAMFVDQLHSIKTNLNKQFFPKNTSITYHGSALIAVANAKQIKNDIITTVVISMGLLMLILVLYYRKVLIPVIIFIPTIFGVAAALALLYFIKGTISAISLSIGAVLLGVTIDYSLHILTHYKHTRNLNALYKDVTMPLIMSSTTTAVAFLCLLFVKSEALQDLGIFAAASVVFSSLFSLLIIPHLYQTRSQRKSIIDKMAKFPFENNKILLYTSIVIIIISLFTFDSVQFDNDISKLNFVPREIRESEKELETSTNLTSKSLYVVSYGNSVDQVLSQNNRLYADLSKVKSQQGLLNFSSPGAFLTSETVQREKIQQWNSFWQNAGVENLQQNLISSGSEFGFKPTAYQPFYDLLNKEFQ
ncbi:MAG TPA: MMPL family transporter, partial [Flavobacterium sp.]|nr:MMPL family transporter [Flavobacterium sp.]